MKYPNAHSGLKKLLAGEILTFVAGFLLLVAGIFAAVTEAVTEKVAADEAAQAVLVIISLALIIAFSGVGILAVILKIVGLRKASLDDSSFRKALFAALISLGLSIAETVLNIASNSPIANLFTTAISICDIFIVIFVVQGIQNLAEELENEKMVKAGQTVMILIAIAYGFKALTMLFPVFFWGAEDFLASITSSCKIISSLASMIGGILYIVYLIRAIRMLKNS